MMIRMKENKLTFGTYIIILLAIISVIVVVFFMYKYSVEGEMRPPFIIPKIIITSSAKAVDINQGEYGYMADIIQYNDIKIAIQKNSKYKKEAKIRKVTIENIQISETNRANSIAIYRPSQEENLYDYKEQYVVKDKLEYNGGAETNIKSENLMISNQGGILELSAAQDNLGQIQYNENEQVTIDGTLLNRLGIKPEDISFKPTFDLIIELESKTKFKTTITMNLPKGNISENGIELYEYTDYETVFKRI